MIYFFSILCTAISLHTNSPLCITVVTILLKGMHLKHIVGYVFPACTGKQEWNLKWLRFQRPASLQQAFSNLGHQFLSTSSTAIMGKQSAGFWFESYLSKTNFFLYIGPNRQENTAKALLNQHLRRVRKRSILTRTFSISCLFIFGHL